MVNLDRSDLVELFHFRWSTKCVEYNYKISSTMFLRKFVLPDTQRKGVLPFELNWREEFVTKSMDFCHSSNAFKESSGRLPTLIFKCRTL